MEETPVRRRRLGQSELDVSVLALGCWALAGGSGWGEQDEQQAVATIHAALDHGINFLDTAEAYGGGKSEDLVGKALLGRRDEAIVATKISPSHCDPARIRSYCEASLRRLQTDYIDHYIVHWPVTNYPVDDAFAAMQDLKGEGKIRSIGLSNFGAGQLGEGLRSGVQIDADQLCYSLLSRAIEFEILPLCRAQQVSVTAYMPLMQGLLTGKFESPGDVPDFRARTRHFGRERERARHHEPGAEAETFAAIDAIRAIAAEIGAPMADVALAWVIAQPGLTCAIAGARRPDQVARNVGATELELPYEMINRLNVTTEALKRKLGPNADYWHSFEDRRTR
jgi:aryl-alcohol dehydrogenase-like predicted oxidoreductase